jgi:rhodanese-related sulfurtransferase
MLFTAFSLAPVLAQTEGSTDQTYQTITVEQAHHMIKEGSFPNLVILDVRYQCEYTMGHLSGAILIPYNELETRVCELQEHKNHEIIVYCKSGYRSQIACEILAKYNFTKVYNMLGGILAWIDAGYPIWTTSHYVVVDIVNEEFLMQIEPLLLHQTEPAPCAQNQTCPSCGKPANVTSTVLEQEDNYTKILLAYEINGTAFEITIARTLLLSYTEHAYKVNRTLDFAFTEIKTQGSIMQFYSLSYVVHHLEYNVTVYTKLSILDSETYNSSFTILNCAPAEKPEFSSLEFVDINSTATLSQLYTVLGKVAKRIGKGYEKSRDESLTPLAQAYYDMKEEAKHLSKLVEKQLTQYDLEILHSSAVLIDGPLGPPLLDDGGGGGELPPCDFWCIFNCVLSDPQAAAECTYYCYICALVPAPLNPACWACIICILYYSTYCYLECCA